MPVIYRILYYGAGFVAGLVVLFFFLGGKRTSCDYSPNARVLKNIRIKTREFSPTVFALIEQKQIDTAMISQLLESGKVDFSASNTEGNPCNQYVITNENSDLKIASIQVQNCDSIATITKVLY